MKVVERAFEDSIVDVEDMGPSMALARSKVQCMVEEGSTVCLKVGDLCAELVDPDAETQIAAERCRHAGVAQAVRRSRAADEKVGTYQSET